MKKAGVLRNVYALILIISVLVFVSSSIAQTQEWKSSQKKDEIEMFYKTDKVGTDKFDVYVKATNSRSKAVRVTLEIRYEVPAKPGPSNGRTTIILPPPPKQLYYVPCTLDIPSGGTESCEKVTLKTKKVAGVKLARWDYID